MANEQNLRPGEYKFTLEEAKRGGKASAKARREKADLRRCLEILLENEVKSKSGKPLMIDGKAVSGAEALSATLFKEALNGNVKAWEVLRDTAGQKPADKVITSNVDPDIIDEVERMVHGTDEN